MSVDIEKLKAPAERVEACIADVMERFPTDSKDYYVEVHQHLAPLARQLERQNGALRAEVERLRTELQIALDNATYQNIAATKVWRERDELRAKLASGAAAGGNTSEKGTVINYGTPVNKCSAPAAGTVKDAERYQWLKERFTGYDFYWGGEPPYDEEKGKCVIVFECGQDFNAGRNFEAGIDAAIEAHNKASKAQTNKEST